MKTGLLMNITVSLSDAATIPKKQTKKNIQYISLASNTIKNCTASPDFPQSAH